MVKQSCLFAKVCDGEFHQTLIRLNLFSLQLCVHDKVLKVLCEKGSKFVSMCWGLLLGDFRATARSKYHIIFKFS